MKICDDLVFNNTYANLPPRFYQRINPHPVNHPKVIRINERLLRELSAHSLLELDEDRKAAIFSGNKLIEGMAPLAMAYAGHQFGHFVPQLGDGRAILLGEIVDKSGKGWEWQLKGSGVNQFSRRGDGRSALGPALREYIMSESMFNLEVPTTKSLAVVSTGEMVQREEWLPGGIVSRLSKSHVRVGTFEYFSCRHDVEALGILADYSIQKLYPEFLDRDHKYSLFYEAVMERQAKLVAQWMSIGFIHGVMNTDNVSIAGETIDYGPCAFMDEFSVKTVFSAIDRSGRYAYGQQPSIAQWNMKMLGVALLPLFAEKQEEAIDRANSSLNVFEKTFNSEWAKLINSKLGFYKKAVNDTELAQQFLELLEKHKIDFTLSFRSLAERLKKNPDPEIKNVLPESEDFLNFYHLWQKQLLGMGQDFGDTAHKMDTVNPCYIPRNHRVEAAIQAALKDDYSVMDRLMAVMKSPFSIQESERGFLWGPQPAERIQNTFCGT